MQNDIPLKTALCSFCDGFNERVNTVNPVAFFWLILAIVLGIIEAATPSLVCIWLAVSALVVSIFAAFGASIWWQLGIFVVVSAALITATRPLARKFVSKRIISTNADRIIGAEGIVTQTLDKIENTGLVKVMGQVWSAKSAGGENIPEGTLVQVTALEGVKVIVKVK